MASPNVGIPSVAGAGIGVNLDIDYRMSAHASFGVAGQYQQFTSENNTAARGAMGNIGLTIHGAPLQRADPWARLGAGYRLLWSVNPIGGGPTALVHGFELAALNLGYDLRLSEGVAIAPMIGADLTMFIWGEAAGVDACAVERAARDVRLRRCAGALRRGPFDRVVVLVRVVEPCRSPARLVTARPCFGAPRGRGEHASRPAPGALERVARRARSAFEDRAKPLGARRQAQLAQRLGLDLPDALAGERRTTRRSRRACARRHRRGRSACAAPAPRAPSAWREGRASPRRSASAAASRARRRPSLSATKSTRRALPSSPAGVSRLTGSRRAMSAIWALASGRPTSSAISSSVGSRPQSWTRRLRAEARRLPVSTMCTGVRMVRPWSAMARVIDWRIHQVAYVENLKPRL